MTKPILLVHGAWHGAWCWSALQAELDRRGVPSYAVDLPGHGSSTLPFTGLHGDARFVADTIDALASAGHDDIVLVGHSYGGAVISQAAGLVGGVTHLVYLTAFVLDIGESVFGMNGALPPAASGLSAAMQRDDVGNFVLHGESAIIDALYAACPSAVSDAAIARLCPQPLATLTEEVTAPTLATLQGTAPWRSLPSTYIRCTLDQAIPIVHQDHMAARCANVETLDTDHSPFVSAVGDTADILERIARG